MWLDGLRGNWDKLNNFKFHLWWHFALYYLEREDFAKVLEFYDRKFWAEPTDDHIDIANAVSMLGRLEMRGVDVGNRWKDIGNICSRHVDDHLYVFHDVHYIWAITASGRINDVEKFMSSLNEIIDKNTTEGPIFKAVGLPLLEAIVAYIDKDFGKTVDLLLPVRYQIYKIGGSHAQRDVFAQLLIYAAIADGRCELARALVGERLERRPGSPLNWRWLGQALEGLKDAAGAVIAKNKAEKLIAA